MATYFVWSLSSRSSRSNVFQVYRFQIWPNYHLPSPFRVSLEPLSQIFFSRFPFIHFRHPPPPPHNRPAHLHFLFFAVKICRVSKNKFEFFQETERIFLVRKRRDGLALTRKVNGFDLFFPDSIIKIHLSICFPVSTDLSLRYSLFTVSVRFVCFDGQTDNGNILSRNNKKITKKKRRSQPLMWNGISVNNNKTNKNSVDDTSNVSFFRFFGKFSRWSCDAARRQNGHRFYFIYFFFLLPRVSISFDLTKTSWFVLRSRCHEIK